MSPWVFKNVCSGEVLAYELFAFEFQQFWQGAVVIISRLTLSISFVSERSKLFEPRMIWNWSWKQSPVLQQIPTLASFATFMGSVLYDSTKRSQHTRRKAFIHFWCQMILTIIVPTIDEHQKMSSYCSTVYDLQSPLSFTKIEKGVEKEGEHISGTVFKDVRDLSKSR